MNEILTILNEECAEVIQASCKLQRFGLDDKKNLAHLETEISDLLAMVLILYHNGVISEDKVLKGITKKLVKLKKWSDIDNLEDIIKIL